MREAGARARRRQALGLALMAMAVMVVVMAPATVLAAEVTDLKVAIDTVWVLLCGALVFFMNAGFALLETGLCRAKNAASMLSKNFMVAAAAGLAFYLVGFGIMFADGNGLLGLGGLLLRGEDNSPATGAAYRGIFSSLSAAGVPLQAKYFFQACFAMTAASIVSGAVAERIRSSSFLVFSLVLVAVIYPVTGHWIWGGGWLAGMGFWDFAGSTQVHSVGGWAALSGAMVLGPRLGRYSADGKSAAMPGHSLSLATAGTLVLWLGWFAFNAGSTLAADPGAISHIAVTTLLASMAGLASAFIINHLRTGGLDLSMTLNGCLAGLVAITAGCAFVSGPSALIIGAAAGGLVVLAVPLLDRLRVDDPVGAISVHLVNGIFGTLAVGLFAEARFAGAVGDGLFFGGGARLLGAQSLGVLAVGLFVGLGSTLVWLAVRASLGLRVERSVELAGLDRSEMTADAYPGEPGRRGTGVSVLLIKEEAR